MYRKLADVIGEEHAGVVQTEAFLEWVERLSDDSYENRSYTPENIGRFIHYAELIPTRNFIGAPKHETENDRIINDCRHTLRRLAKLYLSQ